MNERAHVWSLLRETLATLPRRNSLILAGDFNTSLHKRCSAVGLPTFLGDGDRRHGPIHSDAHHFHDLLQINHLAALNTWTHSLKATYTFEHRQSRIDYICIKQHLTDVSSKDVHYLHDFALLECSGAQHVPMIGSVLKAWTPEHYASVPGWSRAQRQALYLHWRQHDSVAQELQQHLQTQIESLSTGTSDRLQAVHCCLDHIERKRFHQVPSSSLVSPNVGIFRTFQYHSERLRTITQRCKPPLALIFQAWFHAHHRLCVLVDR